jgi:hypothetical protein
MGIKDLFLTPIFLLLIYGMAYWLRPKVTSKRNKKYFIPALTVKLIGALALGFIYQFYYGQGSASGSGDTFLYFNQTSLLYDAFMESPGIWLRLMFSNGEYDPLTINYTAPMIWYASPTEFIIIKIASVFSIISLHTYSVIALFFAVISFSGMWQMYLTFYKLYPSLHKKLAIAVFFLPSVFFWGSGLLKDSLTIGALGWMFYGFYKLFIEKKQIAKTLVVIMIAAYALFAIKIYILLSFIPPALLWIFNENNKRIKNATVRMITKPIALLLGVGLAFLSATGLTEENSKYDLDKLGEQSKINSEYLAKQVYTGSAYDIGIFDGSIQSFLTVGPQAIVVALYRPFLWEVRNPIMLLSAIEASIFIYFTLLFIFKIGFFKMVKFISTKPILTFCIIFSLVLAFGVGTNSGNFGTLVRYKIPIMPFYLAALFIMQAYLKRPKKLPRLATTA